MRRGMFKINMFSGRQQERRRRRETTTNSQENQEKLVETVTHVDIQSSNFPLCIILTDKYLGS